MYAKALFPIHIYQNNIKNNCVLKDEILTKVKKLYNSKELEVPSGWLTDKLYTSFNHRDLNLKLFSETLTLKTYYEYIKKFFDLDVEVNITDMWFNHYINGDWQEVHSHVGKSIFRYPSNFSCIHFLSYNPEIHSPVIFVDPNEHIRYSSLEMNINHYESRYKARIEEGDFIMFPSYLQHYVPKGNPTPDYPRVTVAINLEVLKYGSQSRD